jgi:hypothetical protein
MDLDEPFGAISLGTFIAGRAVKFKQHVDNLRNTPSIDANQVEDTSARDHRCTRPRNRCTRVRPLDPMPGSFHSSSIKFSASK